ncbi:hypothetical protein [Streptomyces ossamyceticus]|uniref:hypothetical protein n=1 Tax=Streptomyces ossamyceticus TaxID=249581 RepID=UPI0034260D39
MNPKAYEASTADWKRLRAYARKVARQTRRPLAAAIGYTVTDYRTVERQVVREHGPFGLFKRTETRSERQPFSRHVPVIGQHWVLEVRHQNIEKNVGGRGGHHQETTHEKTTYLLLPDGELKCVAVWEEESVHTADGRTQIVVDTSHHVRDIGDRDLRTFDFEKCHREYGRHGRGTKTWGDREPGKRLLVHAKGVGLSAALKRLL